MSALDSVNPAPEFEIDPATPLAVDGLSIHRRVETDVDKFLKQLAHLPGVARVLTQLSISELSRSDTLDHPAFYNVTRGDIEEGIRTDVESINHSMTLRPESLSTRNFSDGNGSLVLIQFVPDDERTLSGEHYGLHRSMGVRVPGVTVGKRFDRPGLPVARMKRGSTSEQRRRVQRRGKLILPGEIELSEAVFRPKVKAAESPDGAMAE